MEHLLSAELHYLQIPRELVYLYDLDAVSAIDGVHKISVLIASVSSESSCESAQTHKSLGCSHIHSWEVKECSDRQ